MTNDVSLKGLIRDYRKYKLSQLASNTRRLYEVGLQNLEDDKSLNRLFNAEKDNSDILWGVSRLGPPVKKLVLGRLLTWGVSNGRVKYPAVKEWFKRELPARRRYKKRWPNGLMMVLMNDENELVRRIMLVATNTGLRTSDLVRLNVNTHFDAANGVITIRQHKTGMMAYIPVAQEVFMEITEKYSYGGFVLFKKGFDGYSDAWQDGLMEHQVYDAIKVALKRHAPQLGLDPQDYSVHGLRHTFITEKLEQGIPLEVVKVMAGHSSIRTTEGYIKELNNKALLERWQGVIKDSRKW